MAITVVYRLEFQDQSNTTFERFFQVGFQSDGSKTTASATEGSRSSWIGVQEIADGKESLSVDTSDGAKIAKVLNLK
jgi:hypothetical protein